MKKVKIEWKEISYAWSYFGIDTSCDDTFALLKNGKELLANLVSSQIDLHKAFGGVVPEIASRNMLSLSTVCTKRGAASCRVFDRSIGKRLG